MQDTWTFRTRWMRIASCKARRSSGPESTRSPSRARAQMGALDRVSEHQMPRINRELDASWAHTWTHRDASIFIEQAKSRENVARVVGHDSTDYGKSDGANRIAIWTACILRGNFSLKTNVFFSFEATLD